MSNNEDRDREAYMTEQKSGNDDAGIESDTNSRTLMTSMSIDNSRSLASSNPVN